MAQKATINIVVLWEEELRAAAKALRRLYELSEQEDVSKEERDKAFKSAIAASYAALYNADEDAACITVTRQPIPEEYRKRWPEVTGVELDDPE